MLPEHLRLVSVKKQGEIKSLPSLNYPYVTLTTLNEESTGLLLEQNLLKRISEKSSVVITPVISPIVDYQIFNLVF